MHHSCPPAKVNKALADEAGSREADDIDRRNTFTLTQLNVAKPDRKRA